MVRDLTGITPRKTVRPDEVIAYGCAIQAAVLDGLVGDLRLVRAPPRKKPVAAEQAAAYRTAYRMAEQAAQIIEHARQQH